MTNTITDNEYNSLSKILNFRLPNGFRKFGIISACLILAFLIAYKFIGSDALIMKDFLRSLILLFLLLASLSKDKLEDEYSRHIRYQSILIATVFTTVYAILIPII